MKCHCGRINLLSLYWLSKTCRVIPIRSIFLGISADIITTLSRSPWLFVTARNTTLTFKGSNVDVRRVAEEFDVRFVLEGSVRRSGEKVRVTARLIDGTTGGQVWSELYDGQLQDAFDLK